MLSTRPFECPAYLLRRAASLPPVATAVVNAGAPLPMESAKRAQQSGLIEPVLVGDADAIRAIAKDMRWDVSRIRVVEAGGEAEAAATAAALASGGEVGVIMKGHIHTDVFMLGLLKAKRNLRTERRADSRVSHDSAG